MPGFMPGIHVFFCVVRIKVKTRMAENGPAMSAVNPVCAASMLERRADIG